MKKNTLDWVYIRKSFPKAYSLFINSKYCSIIKTNTHNDLRVLYDFFDTHKITLWVYSYGGKVYIDAIATNPYMTIVSEGSEFKDRESAEVNLFYRGFNKLNQMLKNGGISSEIKQTLDYINMKEKIKNMSLKELEAAIKKTEKSKKTKKITQ